MSVTSAHGLLYHLIDIYVTELAKVVDNTSEEVSPNSSFGFFCRAGDYGKADFELAYFVGLICFLKEQPSLFPPCPTKAPLTNALLGHASRLVLVFVTLNSHPIQLLGKGVLFFPSSRKHPIQEQRMNSK
jgi:hypothetical protein